jgi:undecaprenyl-diphosphatase
MSRGGRAFWGPLDRAELPLLEWVARRRAEGPVEVATRALTRAGEHGLVWYGVAAVGMVADAPRRRQWREAALTVGAAYLANTAVKAVARRRRPPLAAIGTPTGLSFPSAHSATSFAAARTMSQLVPAVPLYGLASALVASRLHFCVHYPSDLAAGALLGDAIGRATVRRWQANKINAPSGR